MGDMGEVFRAMKAEKKERRQRNLEEAPLMSPLGVWTKHTEHHWGATLLGKKLDWWPSSRKWRWDGKIHTGTYKMLNSWIERRLSKGKKAAHTGENSPQSES